ncbi:MAG: efflux RND transporter periplasmic adaptor subunit [Verrucomicrobiota bacterium]
MAKSVNKRASEPSEKSKRGPILVGVLALLVVAVTVVAIKLIQDAPSAAEAAATAGGGDGGPPAMPPAAVYVEKVRREPAQNLATVTGSLRAVSRSEVAAREAGPIAEILADEGQSVKEDDVLVRLDGRRVKAQLTEAQAAIKSAKSLVAQRTAEVKRATEDQTMKAGLFEDGSVAERILLDAEQALAVSKAQLDAASDSVVEAQSRLDLLEVREADLEIKAPFAGLVTERHVEPGEWVAAGANVMTLISNNPIEAWLNVPERFLQDVRTQPQSVRVNVANFGELTPQSIRIVADVDPRSRLFTAVALLDNADGKLAAGLSTTGRIPVGTYEPHLVMPVDALLRTERGDFVFRAGEGQAPVGERIAVEVAFERGSEIYLLPDRNPQLLESNLVVVEGNDRLQPNQPLLVQERATEPAPPEAEPEPNLETPPQE